MMRSDNFFTSNECSVAEHTMTWKIKRSSPKLLMPPNILLLQHLITVHRFNFTHVIYAQHYLQSLAIRGDLGDLIMDSVDEVRITC